MTESKEGRRILILPVEGPQGELIQQFRREHDPVQAERIPPHLTLAYWAGVDDAASLERQVRHALLSAPTIQLGALDTFIGRQITHVVSIAEHSQLDAARIRLFDETHIALPEQRHEWDWHVSIRRYADSAELPGAAQLSSKLAGQRVSLNTVLWAELQRGAYVPIERWTL